MAPPYAKSLLSGLAMSRFYLGVITVLLQVLKLKMSQMHVNLGRGHMSNECCDTTILRIDCTYQLEYVNMCQRGQCVYIVQSYFGIKASIRFTHRRKHTSHCDCRFIRIY